MEDDRRDACDGGVVPGHENLAIAAASSFDDAICCSCLPMCGRVQYCKIFFLTQLNSKACAVHGGCGQPVRCSQYQPILGSRATVWVAGVLEEFGLEGTDSPNPKPRALVDCLVRAILHYTIL